MARGLSALSFLIFFGCANPARTTPQPHLDFGLADLALPLEQPDLASAADPCTQNFPALAAIGFNLTTALHPSALGNDVLFRGASGGDLNLYYVYRPSDLWLGPVKQNNMTTASAFALVRFEGELEAYY